LGYDKTTVVIGETMLCRSANKAFLALWFHVPLGTAGTLGLE
jgi:hypothetical protein